MSAADTLALFNLARKHFHSEEDATIFISEIEKLVESKVEQKKDILATKTDISLLKEDIANLRVEMKDQKAELIKWMFIFWIGQLAGTIGIILLFVKK